MLAAYSNNYMNADQLQQLITIRLADMATQVEYLYAHGYHEEAALLRDEGLEIANAWDEQEDFMVLGDFTTI